MSLKGHCVLAGLAPQWAPAAAHWSQQLEEKLMGRTMPKRVRKHIRRNLVYSYPMELRPTRIPGWESLKYKPSSWTLSGLLLLSEMFGKDRLSHHL